MTLTNTQRDNLKWRHHNSKSMPNFWATCRCEVQHWNVSQIPRAEAAMYVCSSILISFFLSRTCFRANWAIF